MLPVVPRKAPGEAGFAAKFGRSFPFGAAVLGLAALLPASGAKAQQVLRNPSDDTVCLVYYHIANQTPPFAQFAQTEPAVASANEFDQPKALAAAESQLTALYNSLAGVTTLQIDLQMSMGTYSQLGEYDLDGFGGDESINYNCFGNTFQLQLQFDNSDYAQSWVLNPSQAQDVLARNGGSRAVVASTTIVLTGVSPSAPGEPLILTGDVKKVVVVGGYNKAPLGEYTVKSQ